MHRLVPLAVVALCLLSGGCSDVEYSGPDRIAVDGRVTLDAQPLADAELLFIPTGDTLGQGAVGKTDSQGNFTLRGHGGWAGAPAGTYRVIITKCVMPDGSPCPERSHAAPMDSTARQILLDRYSSVQHSQLSAVVAADVPLEFHLTSKPERRRRW